MWRLNISNIMYSTEFKEIIKLSYPPNLIKDAQVNRRDTTKHVYKATLAEICPFPR